jgi:hypothetical protein
MASIPTPDVAEGTVVGADQGRSAEEFHSGPYHDIRDFGASTSAADNSGAIEEALRQAASDGGAAVVPEGRFSVEGWRGVDVTSSMDGATLLGAAGADSVIVPDGIGFAFFDSFHSDVAIANLRIDAGNAVRGISTQVDHSNEFSNVRFENLWVHDAEEVCIKLSSTGDGTQCEMENLSVWGAYKWHGVGLDNVGGYVDVRNVLAWDNGLGDPTTGGHGVDTSGTHAKVNGFLFVNNMMGAKTTPENVHTELRNGVILNGHQTGFHAYGTNDGVTVLDNVMSRGCGGEGFTLGANEFRIPTQIWAVGNCRDESLPDYNLAAGIEYAYGATIDAKQMTACETQNGSPGIDQSGDDEATGNVSTLVANENGGGTFGNRSQVSYDSVENRSPSIPSIEEIVGSSRSTGPPVRYHDGSGWQDASLRYYDGGQFEDVSVTRLG